MPKISISKNLFHLLLSGNTQKQDFMASSDTFNTYLECAKAELDGEDEHSYKIELNDTNRPDLWTGAGLARQLKCYHSHLFTEEINPYHFFNEVPSKEKYISVDKNIHAIRPYVTGFIASGIKITPHVLDELIQIQEKLCENFGQKRQTLAIGIYRENKITWPIHYKAANPHTTKFTPLDYDEELSLKEILTTHQKGKEYGSIISSHTQFPLLVDSNNEILSMPPIINSNYIGAVQPGDERLFIECTGSDIYMLLLASAILACDCADFGFTITRVISKYPYDTQEGREIASPYYFQKPIYTSVAKVKSYLGKMFTNTVICESLKKMNLKVEEKKEEIHITPPPYRDDFLHEVDIIEDIMIGYGMSNIVPQPIQNFTIGRLTYKEEISRRVVSLMVGMGFQEMLFPYLGSEKIFIRSMYPEKDHTLVLKNIVKVANPLSENYALLRPSGLPHLLEAERVSAHSIYPHKMFEVGKTALLDDSKNYGTRTNTVLSFIMADTQMGFTNINAIVSAFLYYENIEWYAHTISDSRFIENRVAHIIRKKDNTTLGIFGEIHPRVLEAFDITMPIVAGEIQIDILNNTE